MDVTFFWSLTPGMFVDQLSGEVVETLAEQFSGTEKEWREKLIECIMNTVQELQNATMSKWGRAKRYSIDVYTSEKMLAVFKDCVLYSPIEGDDLKLRLDGGPYEVLVADFKVFTLYKLRALCDDMVIVVATFDIGSTPLRTMVGRVMIVNTLKGW